jgi:hypothetical protein
MALPESSLLDLLRFDEAEGTIRWKHRRMLLFDADAMGLLRRELVDALGLAAARRILTRFGYACGYRDALTSKELLPWKHQEDCGNWVRGFMPKKGSHTAEHCIPESTQQTTSSKLKASGPIPMKLNSIASISSLFRITLFAGL